MKKIRKNKLSNFNWKRKTKRIVRFSLTIFNFLFLLTMCILFSLITFNILPAPIWTLWPIAIGGAVFLILLWFVLWWLKYDIAFSVGDVDLMEEIDLKKKK